jgi:YbbR domain-containing protein
MSKGDTAHIVVDNLMWLGASMLLAFSIWVVATVESDPIMERSFTGIPIQVMHGEGLVITDQSRSAVIVNVRAPQSIVTQLSEDDIEVRADLSTAGPGSHRVDLVPILSRRASADTSPRQIMVTMEEAREQFVEVHALVTQPPPRGYEVVGEPLFEVSQVLVSGPVSRVEDVVAAQVVLDLSQQRNTFTDTERLIPVDVDGNTVTGVTLDPSVVQARVQIQPRTDIREVRVIPNLLYDTLPEGYAPTSISLTPDTIVITGTAESLESAPGALFTDAIDLTGRTASFQEVVGVQMMDNDLFIVGSQNITVSVGITPLIGSRQFDRIPVEIIGLAEGLHAAPAPGEVTVLLTGPQITLEALQPENLRVVVDTNGLEPGSYQITPDVSITQALANLNSITVLPAEIDVQITQPGETIPTATPTG